MPNHYLIVEIKKKLGYGTVYIKFFLNCILMIVYQNDFSGFDQSFNINL